MSYHELNSGYGKGFHICTGTACLVYQPIEFYKIQLQVWLCGYQTEDFLILCIHIEQQHPYTKVQQNLS